MNNRSIIKKLKKRQTKTLWGSRCFVKIRLPGDFQVKPINEYGDFNYNIYWQKNSGHSKKYGYTYLWYIEKPHYIHHTIKEISKKFKGIEFKIM